MDRLMFTGLIEEVGRIESAVRRGSLLDITVRAETVIEGTRIGDSISIHGACQTVVAVGDSTFTVQAVEETLRRTTLGSLRTGAHVNLERSLRLGDRFGGHMVMGHVDGVGKIVKVGGTSENIILSIAPPAGLTRYVAEKGSVAVDGVSLTVTHLTGGEFGVSVIPHTIGATTLGNARPGDAVNLEADIVARYVERLMGRTDALSLDRLAGLGF
jgi:riboflavin synthase